MLRILRTAVGTRLCNTGSCIRRLVEKGKGKKKTKKAWGGET